MCVQAAADEPNASATPQYFEPNRRTITALIAIIAPCKQSRVGVRFTTTPTWLETTKPATVVFKLCAPQHNQALTLPRVPYTLYAITHLRSTVYGLQQHTASADL